ncbi:MAG TPA: dipeptidase [Blastocatellia bacterium]|jgi:membrane dipeptidase|nr:dipeptidase [Blastocatellia bacterium]
MNKKLLRVKKKVLIALTAILAVTVVLVFFVLPAQLEKRLNVSLKPPPYQASARAEDLHKQLLICDLHADSLLWDRDLMERGTRGHVDVPRLIDGNVALQAFTIVTKTPYVWKMNIERNDDSSDNIALLAVAERWPIATWSSLTERALYQARKLHDVEARSAGKFVIIKTSADLSNYLERRTHEGGITAGFLGIEGAHALDGNLENVDALYDAGFRMMAPTHFFDNDIGGSAHGVEKGGLTDKGREMVRRMEAKKMTVDLAHASEKTIYDVLAMATRPVVVSHTGVRGTCDNQRNLSDEQLRAIARTGGVIGIGFWDTAVCGKDAQAIAQAIRYTANLIGVKHVGLGSDYDGAVVTPFDTTGLVEITDALLTEGFSDEEIKMIMGGNVLRLLLQNLP